MNSRHTDKEGQMHMFTDSREKGSGEWGTFSAVRDDTVDSYRVAVPRHPIVLREPHRVLRIVYPRYIPSF